uniref:Endoglin, like n=2 Tax=Mastacembelus armatus TaxID=205130 RepID=A0A3Q3LMA7_9TELE
MFLSHNYMTSDLQPQEMQGCVLAPAGGISPEVHLIKLHSAGSGLCGSLQVEVIVSLVPPVFGPKGQNVVLILSSSVPVNWAIVARGVRGHISVYSSNSVSPPYPPEPNLTLSSTLDSDLSTILDLRVWANENGFTTVTSYTEADLANRFVVQLTGGGTDVAAVVKPLVLRPPWVEESTLRQWLNGGGRESFTVQCEDGLLNVTVDQHILQGWPVPVAAVTLQDPTCQAQTNGSHFLLVFPVISCGTEAVLLGRPRGVQYKNMVLLWRDQPQSILALSETEKKSRSPLSIQFSCWMAVPSPPGPAADNIDEANPVQVGLVPWGPEVPNPNSEFHQPPGHRQGSKPVLLLKLFVAEDYEQRRIGPCVVTADHRVYAEISAKGLLTDVVEVRSCVVSPLSDPKKSPFWSVMSEGCSSDPSLTLTAPKNNEEAEGEGDLEEQREEKEEDDVQRRHKPEVAAVEEVQVQRLRFSFILRPVYNDSMQFLHCSLQLCGSDSTRGKSMKEPETKDCQDGRRIPPLVFKSPRHQCEIRNLSRPMVVTRSITSLAPKVPRPPAGPRTKRLSVSPQIGPNPDSSSVLEMGPVMGIVFAAFVMGIGLMGGLWCIYNHTGGRPASLGGDQSHLTDQTHGGHNIWSPSPQSDPSSSSV